MVVPSSSSPEWKQLVTGKKQCDFEFLAARMTMGRLRLMIDSNPNNAAAIQQSIDEIREVFVKNINLPKVQRDLGKVFTQGGLS